MLKSVKSIIYRLDRELITAMKIASMPLARFAIFIVYAWFGILKVIGASPANPIVKALLEKTLPFLTFEQFIITFGLFEVAIGLLFLFPKLDRLAVLLLVPHLITTVMPLLLLPGTTWQGFLVPTIEGQYIIKNILIVALVFSLAAHLKPLEERD